LCPKKKKVGKDKTKILTKGQSDVWVQDKLLPKLKDPGSFIIVTKYDRKHPNNFNFRIEVIDPLKEEKYNENIKEEPPKAIARHDNSMNTSNRLIGRLIEI
jgi:hypothetical protein